MTKKYYYEFHCYSCPVCGNGEGKFEKHRVYRKKPKNINKRYFWHTAYDWCNEI